MNKAAVFSHLRATAAAHRHDAPTIHFEDEHVAKRMGERGIVIDDLVRTFRAPRAEDVRESVNGPGRWEIRGRALGGFDFFAVVVPLGDNRPRTVVITVIDRPRRGRQ